MVKQKSRKKWNLIFVKHKNNIWVSITEVEENDEIWQKNKIQ